MHGFTDVPASSFFPDKPATDSSTRGYNLKLVKSHCHTDSRLYFFSSRVLNRWNRFSLIQEIVKAQTVNGFNGHLNCLRSKNRFIHGLYVRITLLAADFDT